MICVEFLDGSCERVSGKCAASDDGKGLTHIQALYRIEKDLRGLIADQRHAARQECSKPIIDTLELWLAQSRARVSAKSPTGEALKYIAKYWDGLCLFLDDGRIELDNNTVERTIRPIALNRKNALFAGHDAGAQNWAVIASLIETCLGVLGSDLIKFDAEA